MLDASHVFTIVLALIQGLVAVVLWFIKGTIAEVKAGLNEARDKHTKLLEQLPREYVMREEFMRIMAGVEGKLGGLDGKIDRVLEKLERHVVDEARTESSYNRLGPAMREVKER